MYNWGAHVVRHTIAHASASESQLGVVAADTYKGCLHLRVTPIVGCGKRYVGAWCRCSSCNQRNWRRIWNTSLSTCWSRHRYVVAGTLWTLPWLSHKHVHMISTAYMDTYTTSWACCDFCDAWHLWKHVLQKIVYMAGNRQKQQDERAACSSCAACT